MIGRARRFVVRSAFALIATAIAIRSLWSAADAGTPPASGPVTSPWLDLLTRWAFRAAVLGALAGVIGLLVLISGVVPIKASSGHWAITEAFLQFAKRRSVSTHTLGIDAPGLDDQRLVMMGAGHYDFGCRPCHGSPALRQPEIAAQMLPKPPDLRDSVAKYDPAELFYIVKHGVKLTGMPAWPATGRDDEVWAVVAFLRRLPTLDSREYRELAGTLRPQQAAEPLEDLVEPDPPPRVVNESCSRCHGTDGMGRGPGAFPRLAGQRPTYVVATLQAYARGERHSGIMGPLAAALEPHAMQEIAKYYATRRARPSKASPAPAEMENGRIIAMRGLPDRLVPPCTECHGPGPTRRNEHYPKLAGQYEEYLRQQLSLFKSGRRGGTPFHHIMHKVASQLTEEQVRAVAAYYASLPLQRDE